MGENNYGSLEDWNGGNRAREIRHVGFENEMVEYIIRGISLPCSREEVSLLVHCVRVLMAASKPQATGGQLLHAIFLCNRDLLICGDRTRHRNLNENQKRMILTHRNKKET